MSDKSNQLNHRVYLLSCAHCGCCLSDRGMKAVLLLRPSITLFSTDTLPSNCGPINEYLGDPRAEKQQALERTCDCLTQTLGCYGCGTTIGYHIICPCSRCVDSVSKSRRAANGHRWVFHYGEINYKERVYIENEPGIYNQKKVIRNRAKNQSSDCSSSSSSSSSSPPPLNPNLSLNDCLNNKEDEAEAAGNNGFYRDLDNPNRFLNVPNQHPSINRLHSSSSSSSSLDRNQSINHHHEGEVQFEFDLKEGDPIFWFHLIESHQFDNDQHQEHYKKKSNRRKHGNRSNSSSSSCCSCCCNDFKSSDSTVDYDLDLFDMSFRSSRPAR